MPVVTEPTEPVVEPVVVEGEKPEGEKPEGEKPEGEPTPEALAAAEAAEAKTAKDAEDAKNAELPEWARAELSRVRHEAAGYRTSLRAAETKLEGAKTPEEFATALSDLKAENALMVRTAISTKFKLPEELASVLKGDTPEELEAHAKVLSKFAVNTVTPEHLEGGLDPSEKDESFDPVAEARKARANRY